MMMGLGVGAWVPAVFHIFTHAFFKCCLFLCAGSVAHTGSHHSFDMKSDMGGLRKKMPITFITWMLSTAALCGVPFFSGFFSKDEIIDGAKHNHYTAFFVIGLAGAFMTAAYMTRATYLTFFGAPRGAAAGLHHGDERGEEHELEVHDTNMHDVHAHDAQAVAHGHAADGHDDHHETAHAKPAFGIEGESPYLLVLPLVVLSFLAVVSGYLNSAPFNIEKFHHWMESSIGVEVPEAATFEWINAVPSMVLVALGVLVSAALCTSVFGESASRLQGLTHRSKVLGAGHRFLVNKYYLDALYENVIVRAIAHPIAKAAYWFNQHVLDAIVDSVGIGGRRTGEWLYRNVDQRVVDGAVNGSGSVASGTGSALRPLQSGKVNQYGALLFSAAAIAALVLVIVNT